MTFGQTRRYPGPIYGMACYDRDEDGSSDTTGSRRVVTCACACKPFVVRDIHDGPIFVALTMPGPYRRMAHRSRIASVRAFNTGFNR